MTTAGDVETQSGMASHLLLANRSMKDEYFSNADGELLVVPQLGRLLFFTEFGKIEIGPGEVCVIPRGVIFRVELLDAEARAYVCENYAGSFALPERGPIGANCLANSRDFLTPVAAYEDREAPSVLYMKWCGELFRTSIGQSPLDVVAWHGNYAPYKYDLRRYLARRGGTAFDHPDPSIYTVMTSPSESPGTANIDFVIFPERWAVAENTFRPPWYHRNIMSEFMGLIYGIYDAKPEGFVPGGMSLHNMMLPHEPDKALPSSTRATIKLRPSRLTNSLASHVRVAISPEADQFFIDGGRSPRRLRRLLERSQEGVYRKAVTGFTPRISFASLEDDAVPECADKFSFRTIKRCNDPLLLATLSILAYQIDALGPAPPLQRVLQD